MHHVVAQSAVHGEKVDNEAIEERDRILLEYIPQVRYIAGRIAIRLPQHVDIADLESVGIIGLFDAIEKFDSSKGIKFKTYAQIRIKGAILDELRARDWMPRSLRQKSNQLEAATAEVSKKLGREARDEEIASNLGVALEGFYSLLNEVKSTSVISVEDLGLGSSSNDMCLNILVDKKLETQSEKLLIKEIREKLADAINSLSEQERLVISLYYYEEMTLKEIGAVLEVTESRVCQVHTKAVIRLKNKLKDTLS